ncbi:MAG: phospholipase D-like domain-containing protein [Acidobacteriota bacterium]|nr:phospholipase D-like domain-containing protein [Acidobacteriota bacterium]
MRWNGRSTKALAAVGAGAMLVHGAKTLIHLFGPQPDYAINGEQPGVLDSDEFVQFLSVITDGTRRRSRVRRLKNGVQFYPEYIEVIRQAKHSINLEFYELLQGKVGDELLDALTERASAGVEVRVIVDAIGSFSTPNAYFRGLRAAGGDMRWYHPVRWDTWPNLNQRTHRKLLIVDGETGFIGGAGVGDHWLYGTEQEPVWRDTVFRVEGDGVAGMVSTFSENWLEASGEILAGRNQFNFRAAPDGAESFVVSSTPRGGGTKARILFQTLIKSAQKSIRITTPYFLPDRAARRALAEAVARRGVQVQILMAGPKIDHPIIRDLSRRSVRHMVRAGAEVYLYQPAMIHAKLMTIDGMWSVVGSTNFDRRSFALNDEVNMAVLDRELASVLEADLADDLTKSRRLTLEQVRTLFEAPEVLANLLESGG